MIPSHVYEKSLRSFLEPILPYLDDPSVSEVMINGPDHIYVERRGQLSRVDARFSSQEHRCGVKHHHSKSLHKKNAGTTPAFFVYCTFPLYANLRRHSPQNIHRIKPGTILHPRGSSFP